MIDSRKTRGSYWLAMGLIALPVLYVASFFVAAWLLDPIHSRSLENAFAIFYFPLIWFVEHVVFR